MAFSMSPSLISFIGIGNRPYTSPSFSCSNKIQNEVPTVGAVLVRATPGKNLPRIGLPIKLCRPTSHVRTNCNSGGYSSDGEKGGISNSKDVAPLDKSFPISNSPYKTRRPLAEILSDLNKKIIVKAPVHGDSPAGTPFIPWYHANRMLNFYAPGWYGRVHNVIFSDDGSVSVVYRVTLNGSDGSVKYESTGTVYPSNGPIRDPVATAEELAFCKACARFGLGLYLNHEDSPLFRKE